MFSERTNWKLETNRLADALAKRRQSGQPILDLTASNPTTCGFRYHSGSLLRALSNPSAAVYDPDPRGLIVARRAVVDYYASHKIQVAIDDLILTTSTSEAYSFVFRLLCNPGDEILIPEPSYPLFAYLAQIQDVKLVPYALVYDHGWQIDFHGLQNSITARTRAVIVVHPNNPTGHFTKPAEIAELNRICAAGNLAIIADEVFLDFAGHHETKPPSFAANQAALTFTMSGVSKICGLPQMKLAWLLATGPENLKAPAFERLEIIADTYLAMNAPVQYALPTFLDQRREFQTQILARVQKNLADLDRQLALQKSCARLEVEAGWYAVLRIPATRSDEDLALDLLESKGVYAHPGHFYDFASDGFLVVSLITPEEDFAEGIKQLLSMFA
ncbi:MAG TPA: pyridoxal phosphate-dependent aminotransferase [Candidatus Acidoferrales bacterium]